MKRQLKLIANEEMLIDEITRAFDYASTQGSIKKLKTYSSFEIAKKYIEYKNLMKNIKYGKTKE